MNGFSGDAQIKVSGGTSQFSPLKLHNHDRLVFHLHWFFTFTETEKGQEEERDLHVRS